MKKITELKKEELFHVASLINNNYIFNFNTFETVVDKNQIMLGANNCVWILLNHEEGDLKTIGHRTNIGWANIDLKMYYSVKSYLKDLNYVVQGYEPSTKISIDDSIKMLKVAIEDNIEFDEDEIEDVLLDVTNSYKKQLNKNYGK
ncbi:hypothetical protein M1M25_gp104 [Tenacibaculum phage Gundel_1]|uniref:Uncharacterized protein n=1 Tax=Tenacibaculum phage Gundel_1 TaxID=2745672 RepID=A0A8E5EC30_9CAUD|nr:hypothetical protein M1M25_gp104 [Tenacibaculum phage Gundel_1]QQV91437.1 hypothetical protein Gundel1_114 [Tenacibaculum phage Gundel_1]